LHGYVLGQADFLFDYLPWQSVRPAGWRVRNPLMGDPPMAFYPFLFHARSEVLRGHFPLWSSAMGGGQPLFAAMQTAVLSPFTLFDYILPFPASFTLDVAARLFVGGLGMSLFLRSLTVGRAAALFGGVAYLLNPFSIVWLERPLSAVAAGLPWCLLAVEWCATRSDRRAFALMAIVTALMIISGHVYRNDRVQPRAFLADRYVVFRGNEARRAIRDTVDLTRTAVLESPLGAALQPEPALDDTGHGGALTVRRRRRVSHHARPGPPITDPDRRYYPGWVATVDRIEVPILRSDFAFRAVSVPAGDHLVEFRYRPASVRYGAWMSALGALFFVLVLFHRKKRGVLRES
jgi:hypothetical protein